MFNKWHIRLLSKCDWYTRWHGQSVHSLVHFFVLTVVGGALAITIGKGFGASPLSGYNPIRMKVLASTESVLVTWPQIYHKYGALFISTPADAMSAYNQGLTLSLFEPHLMTTTLRQTYQQLGMTYIDDYPWSMIQGTCGTTGGSGACTLTDAQKQTILTNVQNHLNQTLNDPQIAGYMLLDDYPGGDVRDVMQNIHDMITEANKTAVFPRFTECDFGGRLSFKTSSTATEWMTNTSAFDKAVTNYSPTACDTVMLYLEGYNSPTYYNNPELIDWSMSTLLPYIMSTLKAKGWNPATQPLIGGPQLYDWTESWWQANVGNATIWMVRPTAASVATQIEAYCKAGATTITGYAWNDPSHDMSVKYELSTDPEILKGYLAGIQACQSIWNVVPTVAPTPTLLPTPSFSPPVTNADLVPPTVTFTSPTDNMVVRKNTNLNIGVSARDNVGVTKVEIYIDGKLVAIDTVTPYGYRWNGKGIATGIHIITAIGYDAAGNMGIARVTSIKQ